MIRRPPRSTRTDTLFPYTTLFRSGGATLTTGSTVSSYSAPVAPPVQNFWLNSLNPLNESFFISEVFPDNRSEEHTSELQSLMRISYAVFCLKKKKNKAISTQHQ